MMKPLFFIYSVTACLFLAGCARPNYQKQQTTALPNIETPAQTDQENSNQNNQASTHEPPISTTCSLYFPYTKLCAELIWEKQPTDSETGSFTLQFQDTHHQPTALEAGLSLAIYLWMPSMNHGSSPMQIQQIGPGLYKVNRVYFIMPGQWDLHIQLKMNEQVQDEFVQKFTI